MMMARNPGRMRLKLPKVDSFERPWIATAVRSYCRTRLHTIGENVGPEVLADAAIGHAWWNAENASTLQTTGARRWSLRARGRPRRQWSRQERSRSRPDRRRR